MSAVLKETPSPAVTFSNLTEAWGNPEFGGAEELCKNINALLVQLGPAFHSTPDRLQVYASLPSALMALAFEGKKAVGKMNIAVIFDEDMTHAVIENVVVDKNCRGRGVGRSLFEMCLAYAKRWKVEYITLASGDQRTDAHAFYRTLGFYVPETETNFCYEL